MTFLSHVLAKRRRFRDRGSLGELLVGAVPGTCTCVEVMPTSSTRSIGAHHNHCHSNGSQEKADPQTQCSAGAGQSKIAPQMVVVVFVVVGLVVLVSFF